MRRFFDRLIRSVRPLVNRSLWAKALVTAIDDALWGAKVRLGKLATDSGTTHRELPLEDSVRYIEGVFDGYRKLAGVERWVGVAAELGPGDSAGVAVLLRAYGSERVDLIDRYQPRKDDAQQARILASLAKRHDLSALGVDRAGAGGSPSAGIRWRTGQAAEVYFRSLADRGERPYDFIGSWAVLEHLYDPLGALESMVACLRPGGRMVHVVDLRDHGMFSPPQPELAFLSFPGRVYRLMTRNSGRPNRVLYHRYRALAERLGASGGIRFDLQVTALVGVGLLEQWGPYDRIAAELRDRALAAVTRQRARLAPEFQAVSSDDLSVAGLVLTACVEKP